MLLIIVILLLMSVGTFPRWDHASDWGYGPFGGLLGLLLLILILRLLGVV